MHLLYQLNMEICVPKLPGSNQTFAQPWSYRHVYLMKDVLAGKNAARVDVENHASLEFLLYHSQHTKQQENRHHHSQNSYQIWGIYQIF